MSTKDKELDRIIIALPIKIATSKRPLLVADASEFLQANSNGVDCVLFAQNDHVHFRQ